MGNCKGISEIAIWNVIHSCPRIQQLDISNCNITCATINKIELYIKTRRVYCAARFHRSAFRFLSLDKFKLERISQFKNQRTDVYVNKNE